MQSQHTGNRADQLHLQAATKPPTGARLVSLLPVMRAHVRNPHLADGLVATAHHQLPVIRQCCCAKHQQLCRAIQMLEPAAGRCRGVGGCQSMPPAAACAAQASAKASSCCIEIKLCCKRCIGMIKHANEHSKQPPATAPPHHQLTLSHCCCCCCRWHLWRHCLQLQPHSRLHCCCCCC